ISDPSPTYARVVPWVMAVGNITRTLTAAPPPPSVRAEERIKEPASTSLGPRMSTPAPLTATGAIPVGGPRNASTVPSTVASDRTPVPLTAARVTTYELAFADISTGS